MKLRNTIKVFARTFSVNNAATGGHQVDGAWMNGLHHTKTIAVKDLALKEVSDGGDTDVRVRSYIDAFAGRKFCWPHVIEEDKGTHHALPCGGKHATHGEFAEILFPRSDAKADMALLLCANGLITTEITHGDLSEFWTVLVRQCGDSGSIATPLG